MNPVPSIFLSKTKLDDYLLEILTELGKKGDIFSDRCLMNSESNLVSIMGSTSRVQDYLESPEKDSESVINIDLLNELVEQIVALVGQLQVCIS